MDVDTQRNVGRAMLVFGALIASPLDETVATLATGGVAAPAALLQGPATFVGGLTTMGLGAVLLYSVPPKRKR